jgi:hypothetical protein
VRPPRPGSSSTQRSASCHRTSSAAAGQTSLLSGLLVPCATVMQ